MHAREWISPAAVTYLIRKLAGAEDHESKNETLNVIKYFDWYIMPLANPDGRSIIYFLF